MSMTPSIQKKINQVKVDWMNPDSGSTFFSALLSFMHIEIDDSMSTAWTDAISIGLSPDLVEKCTVAELSGVLMHELGHVTKDHIQICMENDWINSSDHNIACDHNINLEIAAAGFVLPHWIDPYQDPKYTGWSSMAIYADIQKNPPPPKPNGMGDDIRMPESMPIEEVKEKIISNIVKATMQAEKANDYGSVPGHIQRFVKDVLSPQLPWYMILANYLTAISRDDYSMRRPNRKYMPDFYMPSLYSESMGHAIHAYDVSGSITEAELNLATAEGKYFWDTIQPESLRLISFDTKIHLNIVLTPGDEYPTDLDLMGGGGTNVIPVLKYVKEEDPKLCLIFTDGGFLMPDLSQITSDIFWIIKGCPTFSPPHGTVIHMD